MTQTASHPVDQAVKARLYDSRWTEDELLDAKLLAEKQMQEAARNVDEAIHAFREDVRYWRLIETAATR